MLSLFIVICTVNASKNLPNLEQSNQIHKVRFPIANFSVYCYQCDNPEPGQYFCKIPQFTFLLHRPRGIFRNVPDFLPHFEQAGDRKNRAEVLCLQTYVHEKLKDWWLINSSAKVLPTQDVATLKKPTCLTLSELLLLEQGHLGVMNSWFNF